MDSEVRRPGITSPSPAQGEEALVADESKGESPHLILLKNGARHDLRVAAAVRDTLRRLSGTQPTLFLAAHSLAIGEEVSPAMLRELTRTLLVAKDGALLPVVRDVIESGFQRTQEGAVLVDPFNPESEADRQAVQEHQRRTDERILRWYGSGSPPDDTGPARS